MLHARTLLFPSHQCLKCLRSRFSRPRVFTAVSHSVLAERYRVSDLAVAVGVPRTRRDLTVCSVISGLTLAALPCRPDRVAGLATPYRAPCRTAHCRQAAAAAMAGDEHYPASPKSRKAPLSMRHDEVVTFVGSVSPEEPPSVSSGSPAQLPCSAGV
jgi:hypothetical protein